MTDLYGKTPSVWLSTVESTAYPALDHKITVDVAIVGAGITGLTLAAWLKEAGRTVAVLDMARVGGGVTGCTTAHITEIVDGRYQKLISNFGESGARHIADSSHAAIEMIAEMVKQKSIDCDWMRVPGYLYTEYEDKAGDIEKEVEAARKLGVNCELVYQTPLPFPVKIALKVDNQAQFHPLKYIHALAKTIPGDGSYLFENTHVTQFEDGEPCSIITSNGEVTAREMVLATHIPIGVNLSLQTRVAPYRSYVMGVHLASAPVPDGLYWDTEDPYNYIRSYGDVLIVGGRDHKTGQREDAEVSYTELERYTREHFEVRDVAYRWSAQVYEPVDNAPYIGLNPGNKHIYIATGYAGNGMTYSTIAARILADQILGRDNPWAEVYSPARVKPLASAAEFVKENLNVGQRFIGDRLSAPDVESVADVPAGQGRIAELEGGKVAVYRSPEGELTILSPECVHMGCLVEWNNAENTWDCPCHGGRYTPTGQVIEGPPLGNLEKHTITEANQM